MKGRRVAERVSRSTSAPAGAALAGLTVALATVLVATAPATPRSEGVAVTSGSEPVRRVVLGCPPDAGAVLAGRAEVGKDQASAADVELTPGGRLDVPVGGVVTAPRAVGPLVLTGDRAAATGLFAGFLDDRGAAGTGVGSCRAPRSSWWFAGAGATASHRSTVFVTNPDQGPAVVDVRLYGTDGPVDAPAGRGLTLAAGASLRLPLEEVAPGQEELTVEVRTSQGRVVAALRDVVAGRAGTGQEWVAAVERPEPSVELLGAPADAQRRTLLVTNSGEDQALVTVQVVTAAGAFIPVGLDEVSVAPGSVTVLDLGDVVAEEVAAVRLSSSAELVGVMRSRRGGDVAHATGTPGLSGPAVVLTHETRGSVQLVAGEEGASVAVRAYDARGGVVAQDVRVVRPSTVAAWPVPADAAYVVVEPRAGTVSAALVHGGAGLAVQPFVELPVSETRPAVLPHR